MATLSYTFESDTAGSSPAGWSILDNVSGSATEEVASYLGSKVYVLSDTSLVTSENTDAGSSLSDVLLSGTFNRGDVSASGLIFLRHDGGVSGSSSGYRFLIGNNTLYLGEITSGSYTSLGTAAKTVTPGTTYNWKFECSGTTIRAKLWTGAEPGWDITNTDSSHASGRVILGSAKTSYYDNISIDSSDISINVDVDQDPIGTVVVSGYDPVVSFDVVSASGEVTVTGYNPVVYQGITVIPGGGDGYNAGEIKIVSYNPTIAAQPTNVYPTLGTLSVSGLSPTVVGQFDTTVAQDPVGAVSITGYNPVVTLPNIASPAGSLVITGFDPTVDAEASNVHLYIKFKDASGNVWTREIGRVPPVVETDANRIASSTNEVVVMDATGGDLTYTLPSLTGRNGFVYEVKKSDSSANTVTVVGTIDNDANFILEVQDECVTVKGGTSTWWITT